MNKKDSLRPLLIICAVVAVLAIVYCIAASCKNCGGGSEPTPPVINEPNDPAVSTVRVTFPEGINIVRYGELLEEKGVCTAESFFNTMNSVDFSGDYSFLPAFSELENRPYKLEGYLFPDTYDFFVDESPESVIKRFLNNFQNRVSEQMIADCANTGSYYNQQLSLDDIIIMASIVEKEVSAVPDKMDGVAAVFYNRMKNPGGTVDGSATGGFFQSDATKYYPYTIYTRPDDFTSEYNTFNVKGLPKGPICCPSIEAIKAAIYPDNSVEAFFFYTDKNGVVYYAVTYAKHLENYNYCRENGLEPEW